VPVRRLPPGGRACRDRRCGHGGTLALDFDGDARPTATADIGADELTTAAFKGLPTATFNDQLSSESVDYSNQRRIPAGLPAGMPTD